MTVPSPHPPHFLGGKRYAAFGPFLRDRFGGRVQRIAIDGGFTCPTRDGTRDSGGCLYCDAEGARAGHVDPELPVAEQLQHGIAAAQRRRKVERFIAYFQAFTNTYAEPEVLRTLYDQGLSDPRVVALAIGTRPDCLDDAVLDLLDGYNQKTYLWLEVGLQSMKDSTLRAMHRGHTVADFTRAAKRLREREIRFVAHVILGLPGDDTEDMLRAADLLNDSGAWGVKIHNLYIDKNAPLAQAYRNGTVQILERAAYLDLVAEFLSRLSPDILVHRLVGQAPRGRLIAPEWCLDKPKLLNDLDRMMEERSLWQGVAQA